MLLLFRKKCDDEGVILNRFGKILWIFAFPYLNY